MPDTHILVGTPQRRVDGRAKVTGAATYAGEFTTPGLLHGYVVNSAIAKAASPGSTPPPPCRCRASSRCSPT